MAADSIGLSALAFVATDVLQSINPTSPRRTILWSAQDATGATAQSQSGPSPQSALYPQIVVEERHHDEMRSTDHPVEQGAAVTDHAYKMPPRVAIRGSWAFGSNTMPAVPSVIPSAVNSALSIIPQATDPSQLTTLYNVLLGIQNSRALVTLVTGKRSYTNLLLEELDVTTEQRTENVLAFEAEFKTLLFATTQIAAVPTAAVMATPSANAATTQMGQTALLPGSNINPGAANAILGQGTTGPGLLQ